MSKEPLFVASQQPKGRGREIGLDGSAFQLPPFREKPERGNH